MGMGYARTSASAFLSLAVRPVRNYNVRQSNIHLVITGISSLFLYGLVFFPFLYAYRRLMHNPEYRWTCCYGLGLDSGVYVLDQILLYVLQTDLVTAFFTMMVGLAMAELCSSIPTSER